MRRDDVSDTEDEEDDDDWAEPDEQELAADVRRRVLAALPRVLAALDRVVLGGHKFQSDDARHACVALLRLAPRLLAKADRSAQDNSCLGYHPSHTPQRAAELLRRILREEAPREEARIARGEPLDLDCKPFDPEDES